MGENLQLTTTIDMVDILLEENMIRKELLDILVCPKCKGPIKLTESGDGLVCEKCRLVYAIRDDIPVMLVDEAQPLEAGEGS
jgi:uncharacterized protein